MVFIFVYTIFAPVKKMKRLLLAILTTLASATSVSGETQVDSLVMNRMYSFLNNNVDKLEGFSTNVYAKHLYQVHNRNI